jgi:hypothetical protein
MHNDQDPEFKAKVEVQKFFFKQLGEEDAAKFTVHLQEAVDGLTENNRKFVETFRKLLDERTQMEAESPWHPLQYATGGFSNLPLPGRLVIIIVQTSPVKVAEWLFASYRGEGQFSIETQAELQNDGTRRKLVSSCHASFVTYWQYVVLPGFSLTQE